MRSIPAAFLLAVAACAHADDLDQRVERLAR